MKLPVEILQQHLESILEGILLWSQDSKNKFKLKVFSPFPSISNICSDLFCYLC